MLPHIHTIEKCDCIKPAIHSQIFNSLSIVNREDSDQSKLMRILIVIVTVSSRHMALSHETSTMQHQSLLIEKLILLCLFVLSPNWCVCNWQSCILQSGLGYIFGRATFALIGHINALIF